MRSLDELVGKKLGEYQIEEKVGDGTFLTVFRGKHPSLDRDVAVKVLNDNLQSERLKREIKLLAELGGHGHIVDVFYADPFAENPYVVVEYCDSSLKNELAKKNRIEWKQAVDWTCQTLDALSFVHEKGKLHRDIKPSNILISNGGG